MTASAIRVQGLWKEYAIGRREQAGTTFREALLSTLTSPLRHLSRATSEQARDRRFWALKDVTFDIKPGDVVGIIGRNGAGKSTLLKILSRITAPTKGRIEIKGRISSLLEVGTGFHPELTGRENVRLNGAILGMSGAEIAKKFDEIVAFSGVEKFIDTPIKRYSSGMQVRLAFAVAAHLEPEILIIDEVLAVGDTEFQRKCLGKMGEVARQGRTVLFVSHQLGTIARLCTRGMLLTEGSVTTVGNVQPVIAEYMEQIGSAQVMLSRTGQQREPYIKVVETIGESGKAITNFLFDEAIAVRCSIIGKITNPQTILSTTVVSKNGEYVCSSMTELHDLVRSNSTSHRVEIRFPASTLAPKDYTFRVALFVLHGPIFDVHEMICPIKITDNGSSMTKYEQFDYGHVVLDCKSSIMDLNV